MRCIGDRHRLSLCAGYQQGASDRAVAGDDQTRAVRSHQHTADSRYGGSVTQAR